LLPNDSVTKPLRAKDHFPRENGGIRRETEEEEEDEDEEQPVGRGDGAKKDGGKVLIRVVENERENDASGTRGRPWERRRVARISARPPFLTIAPPTIGESIL
jgi:hypothetical protein